jgi:hypothetical protein
MNLQSLLRGGFTFSNVEGVRTSRETHICISTACYKDSFTFLYVYDVRTSEKTHLCISTACYGDSFTFLYEDVRTSQETPIHLHGLLRGCLYFILS